MGKYSALKSKLVRFQQESSWQDRINAVKQTELFGLSRLELTEQYAKARQTKDELEDQIKLLNTKIEACNQLLVEDLETLGDSSIKNENGTFYIDDKPYPQVQNKKEYLDWIRENKLEDLLSVNYMTTAGMVNEALLNGRELPPGIKVFMKTSIGWRKPN